MAWSIFLSVVSLFLLAYIGAATLYLLALALAYLVLRDRAPGSPAPLNRFAILVPAHNEELLVGTLCQSLLRIDYPREKFEVFVIADNCSDRTAAICRQYPVRVLERRDPEHSGKGHALAWGLQQVALDRVDAVVMVDADNRVDPGLLRELSSLLNQGEQAIQCHNAVGNRDDGWFTQLLYVTRIIGNVFYHHAKAKIGWSSYLMGNGLCFTSSLLRKKGWTAFSNGEDWEYYAQLVGDNVKIGFAPRAKVLHQESRSLNQATSQRLRWSSGKFRIAKTLGLPLFMRGVREGNWTLVDASLPLIFPNYSLQVNLTLFALAVSLLAPASTMKTFFVVSFAGMLGGQTLLFVAGAVIAGSPSKIFRAVLYAPLFLLWKSVIDLLCLTGLYRGKKWVRTRRHQS